MSRPHPRDPGFTAAWSAAWSGDPEELLGWFAADATYTDVAMGGSYTGHAEILRFCRFVLRFAPDSAVEFAPAVVGDGGLHAEWEWRGSTASPLRLRTGELVDLGDATFAVPGVAVCRFDEAGLLTSHRDFWDVTTMLAQAGVRPA